jgi:hypothetical protein
MSKIPKMPRGAFWKTTDNISAPKENFRSACVSEDFVAEIEPIGNYYGWVKPGWATGN